MFATIALSLLNAGLLAIPIAGTAGVLAGIDYHRHSSGQAPLFPPDTGGGNGGNGGGNGSTPEWEGNKPNKTTTVGGVVLSEYCQQYAHVLVNTTTGQNYTLNPNQWGWSQSTGGNLCMNVTTNNNETYATNTTAPKWSATWQYPEGPKTQPVHAYPNIMIHGGVLPSRLGNLSEMKLDFEWTYAKGKTIVVAENSTSRNVDFSCNVAVDMFFDRNETVSQQSSNATYEVMVWFARFGNYTDPIGIDDGIVASRVVEGVNFTLYNGTNSNHQHVLTWVAQNTTAAFTGSIYPLVTVLPTLKLEAVPTDDDYIGYFSFGSETYSSNYSVTFDVVDLAMDIW